MSDLCALVVLFLGLAALFVVMAARHRPHMLGARVACGAARGTVVGHTAEDAVLVAWDRGGTTTEAAARLCVSR